MINVVDTSWVLLCSSLVLLMTPALGFFYAGLVRTKNVLSTLMHSYFTLALITVLWATIGYSLAFGPDIGGIIGDLSYAGLANVGLTAGPYSDSLPHLVFMIFQLTFAVITPALISGAFAERKRFTAFVLFTLLWSLFVYAPVCHWVWANDGWIRNLGALDFAGGTVVHITSGISALICALVIGRRRGFGEVQMEPHNAAFTLLGAGLLWFGWLGFNAGSALGVNGQTVIAFVNTNLAAGAAALTWVCASWLRHKHASILGAAAGIVAGLVGITPAAGFVTPQAALFIGAITGLACFFVVEYLRGKVDDSLDVFGVHGIGGIIGALLTGVFASSSVGVADGLLEGNNNQLWIQFLTVGVVAFYSALMTYLLLKGVNLVVPLRVSEVDELSGLDQSQHGEIAYRLEG